MKTEQTEAKPAVVLEIANQGGDIRTRWSWVEPNVWTERMLTALEQGVKGQKWFSLIDKIYSQRNLMSAFERVKGNGGAAGVDHWTVEMFGNHLEENLERLSNELREGRYQPQAVRRVWIPKLGSREKRPLGIPTIRDRVVQTAMRNVLEPIFERNFAEHSYGFRPRRGSKDALRRVNSLIHQGYPHVVDADLRAYFDTIPRTGLMERVKTKISDGRVLDLIEAYLGQEVMETAKRWIPERGTPQGAVISPLLSNIYLDPLDHIMSEAGIEMVRYADDFVILCRSKEAAHRALDLVREWTASAGLTLHPEKTHIVDLHEGGSFDFLGYHFENGRHWPRKKSLEKLREAMRVKTRRANGLSLKTIIENVNRTLVGWFEYFKHSYKTTFPYLDGWIRMRLRSILRKRHGGKGRGRGQDHQRWPNRFFTEQGLFSLTAAYAEVSQPSRR